MTSRRDVPVELGHRETESSSKRLDLVDTGVSLAKLDPAEPRRVERSTIGELRLLGEIFLIDAFQLSPMTNALTSGKCHAARLHREQSYVKRRCCVSNGSA
jgi:hypothetical protein